MKKPHTFKLIDGKFNAIEARKILIDLIQNKINYHAREIHMMEEHNEGNTDKSIKRVAQLKKSADTLKKVLLQADSKGMQLKIRGTVEITFLE
jgi:hypothetical protein